MAERFYKVLKADGSTEYGAKGFRWSMPKWVGPKRNGHWKAGAWMPVVENPVLCSRGYHACTRDQLVDFLNYGDTICVIELRGTVIRGTDKVVASEARLTEILPWDACAARLFAVECASDVLDNYERSFPNESRVSDCLAVSYLYGLGEASDNERIAAYSAAYSASSAASSAAYSAAYSAYSAASSAASSAAYSAAYSAAGAAAYSAASSAASSAAYSAQRQKNTDRLMWWLGED